MNYTKGIISLVPISLFLSTLISCGQPMITGHPGDTSKVTTQSLDTGDPIDVSIVSSDVIVKLNHLHFSWKNYPRDVSSGAPHFGAHNLWVVTECKDGCEHYVNFSSNKPDVVRIVNVHEASRSMGKVFYIVTLDTPIDWAAKRALTGTSTITASVYDRIGNNKNTSIQFTTLPDTEPPNMCIKCNPV